MGEQGVELAGLEALDVLDVIGFVRLPEQQGARAVGRLSDLGKEMRVPGGHDAVGRKETGVTMVRVQSIALPGVVTQHHIWAHPADPVGNLPTLLQAGLQFAIGPGKERHFAGATEATGGFALFFLTERDQAGSVSFDVPGALRTVRADDVLDPAPRRRPFGQRAATPELDVVRMGADGQGYRWRRQVDSSAGP